MKRAVNVTIILVITLAVAFTAACPSQQTWAAIWKQAGVLADSYITIYAPNWSNKANFDAAWAMAYNDIQNWQTGKPCQNVVQAVNNAASLLAQLPVLDPQQTALMAAIVVTVDQVSSFFTACNPASAGMLQGKFKTEVQAQANHLRKPTSVKDVNKLWTDAGGRLPN